MDLSHLIDIGLAPTSLLTKQASNSDAILAAGHVVALSSLQRQTSLDAAPHIRTLSRSGGKSNAGLHQLAARVEHLLGGCKEERARLGQILLEELKLASSATLSGFLSVSDKVLEPRSVAQAVTRFLLQALETRCDVSAACLLHSRVHLSHLLHLAKHVTFCDVPPCGALVDVFYWALMEWRPGRVQAGCSSAAHLLVASASCLGLVEQLPDSSVDLFLTNAFRLIPYSLSAKQLRELGGVVPGWRRHILILFLDGRTGAVSRRELVKVTQDWGLHSDPTIFRLLKHLLDNDVSFNVPLDSTMPIECRQAPLTMHLADEQVMLVDDTNTGQAFLEYATSAFLSLSHGENLFVGLDAEWRDPRPLSLLQLALRIGTKTTYVFLVDMLAPISEAVLNCCRQILHGDLRRGHHVLSFGSREDRRRLTVAGILPGIADDDVALRALGWMDLQLWDWGLGAQPSLLAVVRQELGAHLDKSLQTSDWDKRPLTNQQIAYAALDASILLQLYDRHGSPKRSSPCIDDPAGTQSASCCRPSPQVCSGPQSTNREAQQQRWQDYCTQLRTKASAELASDNFEKKSLNAHLRFVLPSSLARLMRKMRGLGLDTLILPEGVPAKQLAVEGADEKRIILTRSRKAQLPAEATSRLYILCSEDVDDQLREVIKVFGVEVDPDCLCGRCVQCNAWDWHLALREDVRGNPQVNEKTLQKFEEYWVCGGCGKIFWEGGMFEKAVDHFRTFLPGGSNSDQSSTVGEDIELSATDKHCAMR